MAFRFQCWGFRVSTHSIAFPFPNHKQPLHTINRFSLSNPRQPLHTFSSFSNPRQPLHTINRISLSKPRTTPSHNHFPFKPLTTPTATWVIREQVVVQRREIPSPLALQPQTPNNIQPWYYNPKQLTIIKGGGRGILRCRSVVACWGLGFRVWGLGFEVSGLGFGVEGL